MKNKTKIIKAMKDKLCPAKTMYFTNHSNNSFTRSFGFFIIYACCWLFFLWVLQTVYMFNLILCHFFIYCHWTFCTAVRKVTHRKKNKVWSTHKESEHRAINLSLWSGKIHVDRLIIKKITHSTSVKIDRSINNTAIFNILADFVGCRMTVSAGRSGQERKEWSLQHTLFSTETRKRSSPLSTVQRFGEKAFSLTLTNDKKKKNTKRWCQKVAHNSGPVSSFLDELELWINRFSVSSQNQKLPK